MSKRISKKKKADQKGKLLLGVGLVLVLIFGYGSFKLNESVVERNPTTLCRQDGHIAKETAVIIDSTDSFSQTQAILVKKEMKALLEEAVVDERVTLYVLGEEIGDDVDRLSVCNPGDGSEKSELFSNKRRLREQWEVSFYQRVVNAVDDLIGEHQAERSPILEMLKLVSVQTMYKSPAPEKQIIIVSDMLHHTQSYSHYRKNANYQSFQETAYSLEQRPYLSGVELNILYLVRPRDMNLQNRGHIKFWESLVTENGGYISRVKIIN